jgi:hypothetical protein
MTGFWDSISDSDRLPARASRRQENDDRRQQQAPPTPRQAPPAPRQAPPPNPAPPSAAAEDDFADAVWADSEDAVYEEFTGAPEEKVSSQSSPFTVSGSSGGGSPRRKRLLIVFGIGLVLMVLIAVFAGGDKDREPAEVPLITQTDRRDDPAARTIQQRRRPAQKAARTVRPRAQRKARRARRSVAPSQGPAARTVPAREIEPKTDTTPRYQRELQSILPTDSERKKGEKLVHNTIVALRWMDRNGETYQDDAILAKRLQRRTGIRTIADGERRNNVVKITYVAANNYVMVMTSIGRRGFPVMDSYTLKNDPPR